ncbi:bifunctional [glutamine synthetase] adenylyltransferase/[glutamine synthetase]-adenylyl-L-tyrosine phosphorylase [Aciditerrimonas ferrireducens]|uniref:bifunctional [glutamine synthetase] adenylyltransferase/[glutamine synthetase]-adenylyl-L-tyrosine phosphorylase n=1 Tax=Aciditerrimonas ferrireducens TaxID=667306 RepID=UPI0020036E69|nr:bifunctional [glutamine synthetase] adenylyltransferase/[glutamine synthetase]-adenylyl-L-tyrosine phosphorylase [Aciditerrimonas ferrireducens]MCK4177132.1 bifunctional [glutamine synthetase] adenylyltransferase/[glutamine synthetase]-adenylyl-L-tyrosine phosphorylase [Aciditerrimonas ferrireducens]
MARLPARLDRLVQRSADPAATGPVLERLLEADPTRLSLLVDGQEPSPLAEALVTVVAASSVLAGILLRDTPALGLVAELLAGPPGGPLPGLLEALAAAPSPEALDTLADRALLVVAADDLLRRSTLETVGAAVADRAGALLQGALGLAGGPSGLAVIGMGKLGGAELNYASDVDLLLVGEDERRARQVLELARRRLRVDLDLRPEGRSGALLRSLDGYRAYWRRWVRAWERQALLKARPVAGDPELGQAFAEAAADVVWGQPFSADDLAEVRAMKARTETLVGRQGLGLRDLKRAPGGIRDVEFSVQLLQLVHGRLDPTIRSPGTLPALAALAEAGYVAPEDAVVLAEGYRFLRTVEHRLQLRQGEQVHALPRDPAGLQRLARVLGFADSPAQGAADAFLEALRRERSAVRQVHERLYFRPLLEAFAAVGEDASGDRRVLPAEAVAERLEAFGFPDADRTRQQVQSLARGLTRSSRLMGQLLPLLLDWLSASPDPDLGLGQLRDLVARPHHRGLLVRAFRDSPEQARRLCLVLGTSRFLGELLRRQPQLLPELGAAPPGPGPEPAHWAEDLARRLERLGDPGAQRELLAGVLAAELLETATADLLGQLDPEGVARALTRVAEAVLGAAMAVAGPGLRWAAIGLGRFGGAELSYASDLDLVLVADDRADPEEARRAGERLLGLLHGRAPVERVVRLDLALRPEGGQGPVVRSRASLAGYLARWGQTWERQAMLRARPVAGDPELGADLAALLADFAFEPPLGPTEEAAIRRMKARVERERVPPHEDPEFHLKLGPGALADVEWTVQLLQLRHQVASPGTMAALERLEAVGHLPAADAAALRAAYRFCERTRNRWFLVGALPGGEPPGDALPSRPEQLRALARSLGTTPRDLREDYRRVTRRARAVVTRRFYGMTEPLAFPFAPSPPTRRPRGQPERPPGW